MQIYRQPQFDPAEAWKMMETWLEKNAILPSGDPVNPGARKVLAMGVYIGCRMALINDAFAMTIATHGNQTDGVVLKSIQDGFSKDYAEWIAVNVSNFFANSGFPPPAVFMTEDKKEEPAPPMPLTDEDVSSIMGGLDDFFKGGDGA